MPTTINPPVIAVHSRSVLWRRCVGVAAVVLCLGIPPDARAKPALQDSELDAAIAAAIAKSRAFLLASAANQSYGRASLVAVALLKGGTPKEAPEIQRILTQITARFTDNEFHSSQDHIYDAAVTLMALASASKSKYKAEIQSLAKYIIENQGRDGDWDYQQRVHGDTSISQYALLGLWEAARAGVIVPLEVWDRAAQWHVSRQMADGGFAYHPLPDSARISGGPSLHSMTVAGVGSLHICRRYLFPNAKERYGESRETVRERRVGGGIKYGVLERNDTNEDGVVKETPLLRAKLADIDQAIQKGLRWLTKGFTVDKPSGFPIYYLYGLERMTALASLQKIGDHDWFNEGARHLIAIQGPHGAWNEPNTPLGEVCSTSFGFLFITKATATMLAKDKPEEFGAGILAGGRGLPDDLSDVQVKQGRVEARMLGGGFDKLLAELENPKSSRVEAAQAGLVDKILSEPREKLIGQKDRLLKLAVDPRAEVRRIAMWALGRSSDLRIALVLIKGLEDPDPDVAIEARLSLRVLSRKLTGLGKSVPPVDEAPKREEIDGWRTWYRLARPYEDKDDISTAK